MTPVTLYIDPSVVTYIMKKENLSPDEMSYILNKQSGAYGISGIVQDDPLCGDGDRAGAVRGQVPCPRRQRQALHQVQVSLLPLLITKPEPRSGFVMT